MYTPASFQETDPTRLHALINAHPLGLLISVAEGEPIVSPLPFRLYPDEGPHGVLRAHMARANPHWKLLVDQPNCLVVFQEPGGYVTPNWYPSKAETHKVVPTWNYAVVQARGPISVIDDAAWLHTQLNELTGQHEQARATPWQVSDAPADFIAAQMKAIVGLELPIRQLSGKFKLSQNRPDPDRSGVLQGLSQADDPHAHAGIAALMSVRPD